MQMYSNYQGGGFSSQDTQQVLTKLAPAVLKTAQPMRKIDFKNTATFLLALIALIAGCSNSDRKAMNKTGAPHALKQAVDENSIVQLNSLVKKQFRVSEIVKLKDTLSMIVLDRQIFYPFGKFKDSSSLKDSFKGMKMTEEFQLANSPDTITILRFDLNSSYIKFYKSEETGHYEIVIAKLLEKRVATKPGAQVGMLQADFQKIYFKENIDRFTGDINVIKLISGVQGIIQYYTFKDKKLVNILFDTDYTFDKS